MGSGSIPVIVLGAVVAVGVDMFAFLQVGNSTQVGYLITAITVIAGVVALLWRTSQKKDTRSDEFYSKQLDLAGSNLEAERLARTQERSQLLGQLDSLTTLNREAHEREMKQVLEVTGRQTELLDELLQQQRDRDGTGIPRRRNK